MRIQDLLKDLQHIQNNLASVIELETQHYQVIRDGRVRYAETWQNSKTKIKIASENRHKSPVENEKFLELVRQVSSSLGTTGVEWISESQELARKRRDVLQEVAKEITQLVDILILEVH